MYTGMTNYVTSSTEAKAIADEANATAKATGKSIEDINMEWEDVPKAKRDEVRKRISETLAGWSFGFCFLAVLCSFLVLNLTIIVHELGHGLCAKALGGMIEWILIWPLGGVCFYKPPEIEDADVAKIMDSQGSVRKPLTKGTGTFAPSSDDEEEGSFTRKRAGCLGSSKPATWARVRTDLMLSDRWKIILFGPLTHIPQMLFWFGMLNLSLYLSTDENCQPSWWYLLGPFTPTSEQKLIGHETIGDSAKIWVYLLTFVAWGGVCMNWFLFLMNMFLPMIGWDGGQLLATIMQLKFRARHRTVARTLLFLFPVCTVGLIAFAIWVTWGAQGAIGNISYVWALTILVIVMAASEMFQVWWCDRNDLLEFHPMFQGVHQEGKPDVYPSTCGDSFFTCRSRNRGPLTNEEKLETLQKAGMVQVNTVQVNPADAYAAQERAERLASRPTRQGGPGVDASRGGTGTFSGKGYRLGGD